MKDWNLYLSPKSVDKTFISIIFPKFLEEIDKTCISYLSPKSLD